MRVECRRLRGDSAYNFFPTVRVLPEFTVSFERNPHYDVYVYFGWLIFAWELNFCWSEK